MGKSRIRAAHDTVNRYPMYSFHVHTMDELVIVDCGKSAIIADGQAVQINAPFAALYPRNIPHQQINDTANGYSRYNFLYPREILQAELPVGRLPEFFFAVQLPEKDAAILVELCRLMVETELAETAEFRQIHLLAVIFNEISRLLRVHVPNPVRVKGSALVNEICMYIAQNYSGSLNLDSIAHRFFISRSKLIRLFPEVIGMTVGEYILGVRMIHAKIHLQNGLSVTETAARCGFAGPGYFIKVFRKETGMTPAQFQQKKELSCEMENTNEILDENLIAEVVPEDKKAPEC